MSAMVEPEDYSTMTELAKRRRDGSLLRIKAQMILEEFGLPDSVQALRSDKVPQNHKEEVKKVLMRIAGLDNPSAGGGGPGSGFSIQINVGGQAPAVATPPPLRNVTPAVMPRFQQINMDLAGGLDD